MLSDDAEQVDGKDICPEGLYGSLFHSPGGGPLRVPPSLVFAAANDASSSRTATIQLHSWEPSGVGAASSRVRVREAVGCVLERRGARQQSSGWLRLFDIYICNFVPLYLFGARAIYYIYKYNIV